MENQEQKTNKISIIIIISALVVVSVFAAVLTMFIPEKTKECKDGEILEDGKCVEELPPAEDIIDVTLRANSYFQDSVGVGSTYSNLYQFKSDNTFLYSSKSRVTKNDQAILMRGTWKYSDGKLTLTITEKTLTKNGTEEDDVVNGKILTNYQTITIPTQETKTYNIKSTVEDGLEYITGDLILYKVNLTEEEVNLYFKHEESEPGTFKTVQDFVNEIAKYNDKVKIINSETDFNATSEYKRQFYKLNSLDNVKKYAAELANLATIGVRGLPSTPTSDDYSMLLYHRLVWFVDETYFCIEKQYMRNMILELYDKDLGQNFKVTNYTEAGNYYCNGPGGGFGPGYTLINTSETSKDNVYTYEYKYESVEAQTEMTVKVSFKKDNDLYKLKEFNVYEKNK